MVQIIRKLPRYTETFSIFHFLSTIWESLKLGTANIKGAPSKLPRKLIRFFATKNITPNGGIMVELSHTGALVSAPTTCFVTVVAMTDLLHKSSPLGIGVTHVPETLPEHATPAPDTMFHLVSIEYEFLDALTTASEFHLPQGGKIVPRERAMVLTL